MDSRKSTDTIEEIHPKLEQHLESYQRMEDVMSSQRMKSKEIAPKYLPNVRAASGNTSWTYVDRAVFVEAVPQTIHAMMGAIFRKPAEINLGELENLKGADGSFFRDNVDLRGKSIEDWIMDVTREIIRVGRVVVVVDYSSELMRPYLSTYIGSDAFNWHHEVVGGVQSLDQLRLREEVEEYDLQTFTRYHTKQIRIFERRAVEGLESTVAGIRVFRYQGAEGKDKQWIEVEPWRPLSLAEDLWTAPIPVVPITHRGLSILPERPLLMPLADANISHFQTAADLGWALYQCRICQPIITGVKESEQAQLEQGHTKVWVFGSENAKGSILEPSGSGAAILREDWDRKLELMGQLGARVFRTKTRAAETAEAKRIDESSQESVLQSVIRQGSAGITGALRLCQYWALRGREGADVSCELNDDLFNDGPIDASLLAGFGAAWNSGHYPYAVLQYNYRKHKVYPDDMDDETIAQLHRIERPDMFDPPGAQPPVERQPQGND